MKNRKIKIFVIILIMFLSVNIFAKTFYIDPVNGSNLGNGTITSPWKTLEYIINNNLIETKSYIPPYNPKNPRLKKKNTGAPVKAGDTLILYSGLHGTIKIVNYINNKNITIKNASGNTPVFKQLHIQAGKNWVFQGIVISSEPYNYYIHDKLVFLESHNWQGPVSKIKIMNCNIYSSTTPWQDSTSWLKKASDGIIIRGDSVSIINNNILNIRFGIVMTGDFINVSGNSISNFSGDGIRILGSNNIAENNIIKNCYDVDENHDDGIQSYTTGGLKVDNNIIRQNIILNYEDRNQPLLGSLQGIGCFDGPYYNWTVENNLIVVNHWHGIAFYGLINGKIINNTVLDPTPEIKPGPSWIKIENINAFPSSGCLVMNNVTNTITVTSNTTTGHNAILKSLKDYSSNFIDYKNNDFHLLETSILLDKADSSVSPKNDLDGNPRPSGLLPDIGAYEYQYPLFINETLKFQKLKIYPNPFFNYIDITGINTNVEIELFDNKGRKIKSFYNINLPSKIYLNNLIDGIYFIRITDKFKREHRTIKAVKINLAY